MVFLSADLLHSFSREGVEEEIPSSPSSLFVSIFIHRSLHQILQPKRGLGLVFDEGQYQQGLELVLR